MKMQKAVFSMVMISLFSIGTCTAGQSQAGAECEARFDTMDTNHDGKVTLKEFQNRAINDSNAEKVFHSRDGNGDGFITKDEMCMGKGK
jgi:Ca2+-binding EF-hand superfamily protein